MISNAAHFSMKLDQSISSLLWTSLKETKNAIIIGMYDPFDRHFIAIKVRNYHIAMHIFSAGHWIILAYGILSLTANNLILLVLVPLPALFYISTVKFTDPIEFRDREERNS